MKEKLYLSAFLILNISKRNRLIQKFDLPLTYHTDVQRKLYTIDQTHERLFDFLIFDESFLLSIKFKGREIYFFLKKTKELTNGDIEDDSCPSTYRTTIGWRPKLNTCWFSVRSRKGLKFKSYMCKKKRWSRTLKSYLNSNRWWEELTCCRIVWVHARPFGTEGGWFFFKDCSCFIIIIDWLIDWLKEMRVI